MKKIEIDKNTFELNINPKDAIIVERFFTHNTKRDLEISSLSISQKPIWLNTLIKLIRYYQKNISHRLGNRCVFDPSCSHYSELAFRKKGFFKGVQLTIARLYRCRSKNGGIDELK